MTDHVFGWSNSDHCVNCGLTAAEITERGLHRCTVYIPDRFDTADDFAHIDQVTKSIVKGQ